MTRCHATQQNDQMMCGRCGLQWDVNDPDPPPCAQVERRASVRIESKPLRELLPEILARVAAGAGVDLAVEEILAAVSRAQPAAWVDDTGRVKFALGVVPTPGMKLFSASHQSELHTGTKRVHLAAIDPDLSRVYVSVFEGLPTSRIVKFVPES